MGWFSDLVGGALDFTKKIDPAFKFGTDLAQDTSTKLVRETGRAIGQLGGDSALGNFGRHQEDMADKDNHDQKRWATNTLKAAAASYAGLSAMGESGAAGSGEAAGAASNAAAPDALGYGAGYTVPGEATGSVANQSWLSQLANNKTAQTVALDVAKAALQKKPTDANQAPTKRPVVEMPDPEAQAAARRRKLAEQMARRGRAASILTSDV